MKLIMSNRRAIVFFVLLATASFSSAILHGRAQDKPPKPTTHVSDFAEAVDAGTKERLEKVLDNLEQKTGLHFVIVTIKSAGGKDLYDYSLQLANDWNIGAPASKNKSILLLITADNGKYFTQASRPARASLPDGVIGDMSQRMRPKLEANSYSDGLLIAVRSFVNGVGAHDNFTFEALDSSGADAQIAQTRPRTVENKVRASESPAVSPTNSPKPEATPPVEPPPPTATPTPDSTPSATPTPTPTPSETATPQATATPEVQPSPTATLSETPKSVETATPEASPAMAVATNRSGPSRSNSSIRKPASTANPEDEKEEVELTLTKPVDKRIDLLKQFIATHPTSVAVPRANELLLSAHATLGDQKLKAGDSEGGLREFCLALSEAPADISDRAFIEIVAQIPLNLFVRGQRDAAMSAAHQAEALAKLSARRLAALTQFYLTIEDPSEANRLAELAVQTAPQSALAHQVLGAARHIALQLDDAQQEYAKAVELDPKLTSAKLSLGDLKRANGKFDAALALYREVLQADAANKQARAGLVISLLELGKNNEALQEVTNALNDTNQAKNLSLLTGVAYWSLAHNDLKSGKAFAQKAADLEPRYSWGQIALARAMIADGHPLQAERSLRFARQYAQFPTMDYELATMLASIGLYDEAGETLAHSFTLKDGQIETRLAGRNAVRAASFTELLAPERRAAIFQPAAADSESNATMLKALLSFTTALNASSVNDDDAAAKAQEFASGNDPMRAYRAIYAGSRLLRKGVAFSTIIDLMDLATNGVEAALNVPAATVAVQPDELSETRARALAQGGLPDVPDAPRSALSSLLRARIEDLQGMAFFNNNKSNEAVTRLRLAVSAAPDGTPLKVSSTWHLASALEASGKPDQALLYYIKSYLSGPPDPARRAIIATVYKKVNGTLDGLDEKIGPALSATSTPSSSPSATPTPQP
jgi:predicted Zn-dependent protease